MEQEIQFSSMGGVRNVEEGSHQSERSRSAGNLAFGGIKSIQRSIPESLSEYAVDSLPA